jgi:putative membrane protein
MRATTRILRYSFSGYGRNKILITMRTKSKTLAFVFGCFAIAAACDEDDNKDNKRTLSSTDKSFVENVALGNMTEIELGTIAATKGNTEMVREFGQHMVSEHTTAQNDLKSLSNDYNNVDLPEQLDAQHQQIRQQLMALSGYSFDSLYMNSQIMDHENTLSIFEQERTQGTEQSVKDYANKYYPHIQTHYDQADSIMGVLLANPESN